MWLNLNQKGGVRQLVIAGGVPSCCTVGGQLHCPCCRLWSPPDTRQQALKGNWPTYALLAAVDVLSNFCLVEAYAYTSLTSVTLLDCWTVPCEPPSSMFAAAFVRLWQAGT